MLCFAYHLHTDFKLGISFKALQNWMLGISVVGLLSKCTNLKNQAPDKSWNKFRENKNKFKASRRRNSIKNIKKTDAFSRGYCLGYITASANALSVFSPERFCPPKNTTKGELSATVIAYISENHSNSLKLRANQLVTRALLSTFSCP